jgi:hypothetical protein
MIPGSVDSGGVKTRFLRSVDSGRVARGKSAVSDGEHERPYHRLYLCVNII